LRTKAARSPLPGTLLLFTSATVAACVGPERERHPPPAVTIPPFEEGAFPPRQDEQFFTALAEDRRPRWEIGQVLLQGFIGVGYLESVTIQGGGDPVEIDDSQLDNLPVIGGGGQLKLAGEGLDFGVEAMLSFAFRSDLQAFAVGGGGAVVALDVDVLVLDFFGGPFLSKMIGDRVRVYAGAGPIVHYLEYAQEDDAGAMDEDTSGSGAGFYSRGGIEFLLPSGTLVGFGVRYSDADVDLGAGFGDFELRGVQALITVTRRG
jgi:hypothetical protein